MKKKENKKDDEEISIDWFEDHEVCEDKEEEELDEEDLEEGEEYFEENFFNRRLDHFLANQKKDVSLEKMVAPKTNSLEENFSIQKKDEKKDEKPIEYVPKNEENKMSYKAVSVDTHFSKPQMSTSERILEDQKALYKHLEMSGNIIGNNKSELDPITPEETIKKDYLTKKRI
ncbi:hypothetical protein AUJ61_00725 [Candidatus Pacearchaeota archaeon CG1_02_30_18]|nr:MAG: hypothetical protein AUJ61_00725 [Candidatus Pacearchaeota archaeon CG1_02_30_18]PIN71457.1 MAG: hypothetical protein COV77_01855 [Candidatus Pacearchaeota archaeon CG11_big_fil_rev_8_21_14_0_20_30_13]PJA71228.1 MAG: hypothetical protein CO153_02720 [Candidatus Pacearchaeota archaeon CG_4_9_14_3_um_filter_30_11]